MRAHGVVDSPAGLGLHDHACWAYEDPAEFWAAAAVFLADGVALGQRLLYVDDGEPEELQAHLRGLAARDELVASGRLRIVALADVCPAGGPPDPEALLRTYPEAVDEALGDGFKGLRVAAGVTRLAADPGGRDGLLASEALVDRYTAVAPLTALCGYDRRVLDPDAVRDLCCVHSASNRADGLAPFHLSARSGRGLALAGEIDSFAADSLARVLATAPAGARLDVSGVAFMDHRGLDALTHSTVVPCHVPRSIRRVGELIGVSV